MGTDIKLWMEKKSFSATQDDEPHLFLVFMTFRTEAGETAIWEVCTASPQRSNRIKRISTWRARRSGAVSQSYSTESPYPLIVSPLHFQATSRDSQYRSDSDRGTKKLKAVYLSESTDWLSRPFGQCWVPAVKGEEMNTLLCVFILVPILTRLKMWHHLILYH